MCDVEKGAPWTKEQRGGRGESLSPTSRAPKGEIGLRDLPEEPAFFTRLTEEFIEGIRAGKCDGQMNRILEAIAAREMDILNGPQEEE